MQEYASMPPTGLLCKARAALIHTVFHAAVSQNTCALELASHSGLNSSSAAAAVSHLAILELCVLDIEHAKSSTTLHAEIKGDVQVQRGPG